MIKLYYDSMFERLAYEDIDGRIFITNFSGDEDGWFESAATYFATRPLSDIEYIQKRFELLGEF